MKKDSLLLILKGFCIGCADLVPGVSGGTMAFILGVYARLINALKSFSFPVAGMVCKGRIKDACVVTDIAFLGLILIGVVCAALFFTRVVDLPGLLISHPRYVYGFFFGLVVASAGVLAPQAFPTGKRIGMPLCLLCAGAAFGFYIISSIPADTPQTLWMLLPAGMLASSVMLLPGISGSFVLLLIGQYAHVLGAIKAGDMSAIAVFLGGVALGFALSARLISAALTRFPHQTYALMTGLLLGCAPALWPFQQRFYYDYGKGGLLLSDFYMPVMTAPANPGTCALMLAGAAAVIAIHITASRRAVRADASALH